MARKAYIGERGSYTELEYIESNGAQFIDTGVVADNNTRVVMDFELTDDTTPSSLFGSQTSEGGNNYSFFWDGEQFQSEYGELSDELPVPNPLDRRVVDKNKQTTTLDNYPHTSTAQKFTTAETLKLLATGKSPEFSYKWYHNGEWLDKVTANHLVFSGNKEEEGSYYCEVENTAGGMMVTSKTCTVTVTDNSLLSGATYTSNATEDNWYFNNNPTGAPNVYDENGEFLTDGNIFNDFWQDKYFGVKNIDPVITFDLDKPITFKELDIFVCAGTAGINVPSKVVIDYKVDTLSDWITIYDDAVIGNELYLTTDTPLTAHALRFSFTRNGAFCFIDEIRAFAEFTGKQSNGSLKEVGENTNILSGREYSHDVSTWNGTCKDPNGTALTDGAKGGTWYGDNYLNAKQKNVSVEFDLGESTDIREIFVDAHTDSGAGVYAPHLTLCYKEEKNSEWVTVYSEQMTGDMSLVADKIFKASLLKFDFVATSGAFIFIKEIEAYSRATGVASNGTLAPVEVSLIKGLLPTAESTVITGTAWPSTTDLAVLTDGVVRSNDDSYTGNITFSDSPVTFVYEKEGMEIKEVSIITHNPSDMAVVGTGKVLLALYRHGEYVGGGAKTATINSSTGKMSVYNYDEPKIVDKIKITLEKKSTGDGWPGISLSEIQVFKNIVNKIEDKVVPASVFSTTGNEVANTGNKFTPVIVADLVPGKSVSVGEGFELAVVAAANNPTVTSQASSKLYSCQIYDNDKLVRDFVPCKAKDGSIGVYDKKNGMFYPNLGTSELTAGEEVGTITSENVARRVLRMYVGVKGIARRIKKCYIGIGGVARPYFSHGELVYYGKLKDGLSVGRQSLAATSIGNRAIFGGGYNNGFPTSYVDAYNDSLEKISGVSSLHLPKSGCMATSIEDYALFAGGRSNNTLIKNTIDVYKGDSLSHLNDLYLIRSAYNGAATTVGDYALFGGGETEGSHYVLTSTVSAVKASLEVTYAPDLSVARYSLAAATVGNHALFAGGICDSGNVDTVDAYSDSLAHQILTLHPLSISRNSLAGTSTQNYAFFGGGWATEDSAIVDVYNKELERTTTELSKARSNLSATSVGTFAIFGGGAVSEEGYSDVVDAFDEFLTRTTYELSSGRPGLASTTVGNYALFAGGANGQTAVDAYKLQ